MGLIYILEDKTNEMKYVGQTTKTFNERMGGHFYGSQYVDKAIKDHGIDNFSIITMQCSEEHLDWMEREWIVEMNSLFPNGYNLETGGNKNKHFSEESKRKNSASNRGKQAGEKNGMYGKHHSEETKQKIKEVLKERHPMIGKFGKDHNSSKPVLQFSKDGQFIREWECGMQVERELGFDQGNLTKACRGQYKQAYGFIWKFAPVSLLLQP